MQSLFLTLSMTLVLAANAHTAPSRLAAARTFAYQLQNFSVEELASSPFDVLVIDYSFDGSPDRALTKAQLDTIRLGHPNRKVLAYLSIGEAESYRYYFSRSWTQKAKGGCGIRPSMKAPSWLGEANPSFCDNFKVRFWDSDWQKLLFTKDRKKKGYLDRIIQAGFDGVYLDIIDGFRYWDRSEGDGSRPKAARDMAKLVLAIAHHARVTKKLPGFVVVPQNGSDIIDEIPAALAGKYLDSIDALGAEDTYYFGDADENNDLDPQGFTIGLLKRYVSAGRPVLAIDYLTDSTKISDFAGRACGDGFIPQVGTRFLNSLASNVLQGCR